MNVIQVLGVHAEDRADAPDGAALSRAELPLLPEAARLLWQQERPAEGLVQRVAQEGLASDLASGETPETWSPLGEVKPDSFGSWEVNAAAWQMQAMEDGLGRDLRSEFEVAGTLSTGASILRLQIGASPFGAFAFGIDGYVAPIPPGTDSIEVSIVQDSFVMDEMGEARAALQEVFPQKSMRMALLGDSTSARIPQSSTGWLLFHEIMEVADLP